MIFRRDVLNQWLFALVLHFILFHMAKEMKEESPILPEKHLKVPNVIDDGPANRLMLVVIKGLRWDVFYANSNLSTFPPKIKILGTIEPIYVNFPSTEFQGLERLATGVPATTPNNTFNIFRLSKTLYIGSPVIPSLFGDIKENFTYPEHWNNYTVSPNETQDDEWVFLKWKELMLKQPSIHDTKIFFLYFSGLHKASILDGPFSNRALIEMKYIFDSIQTIYRKTEEFFEDRKTAYFVISDYGFIKEIEDPYHFSNESMIPFMSWGRGLARRNEVSSEERSRLNRKDYYFHEDITPLMSYLLGTVIPPNNFGEAPLSRLSTNPERAKMAIYNAQQLSLLFQSFADVYGFGMARFFAPLKKHHISRYLSEAQELYAKRDYHLSIAKSQDLMEYSFQGIVYYRSYRDHVLWICAVITLIGWSAVTFGWVVEKVKITPIIQREMVPERHEGNEPSITKNLSVFQKILTPIYAINISFFLMFCFIIAILISISPPLIVSLAGILAITVSWLAVKCSLDWIKLWKSLEPLNLKIKKGKPLMYLVYFLLFSCSLSVPILVQAMFSFAIIFTALTDLRYSSGPHLAYWMLSSLSFLILLHYTFDTPYLPVLIIASVVWIVGGGIFLHCLQVNYLDMILFLVAFLSIALISIHSQYGPPTTDPNVFSRWIPMIIIFFIPLIGSSSLSVRLFQITLCLSVTVFLLSLSFEPISLLVISSHIFSWALLEGYTNVSDFFSASLYFPIVTTSIVWNDIRRSFYFLGYILISFLVIGNSCDINNWPKEWSSYFDVNSHLLVFLIVSLKSLPVIIIANVFLAILEKKSSVGYQSVILNLSSLVSLVNFLLIPGSSVCIYNQLMFLFSLLIRPIAYILLTPSLFSFLAGSTPPRNWDTRHPEARVIETPL